MTNSVPRPETIDRLTQGAYSAFAALAGMQLDVFSHLKDGPMSTEQIAQALEVSAEKLRPLLYALVAAGLLTVKNQRFSNTPESDYFLVQGRPTYRGSRISRRWEAMLKTAETIQTGVPQARQDYSNMSPERLERFYRGGHAETMAAGRDLVSRYDFFRYHHLIDVAGGSGGMALAIVQACPHLRATVVDLPNVTPITRRFIQEAQAVDSVQVIGADVICDDLGGPFDVAVMRSFIQVLSSSQAGGAIRNVARALEPGGTLFIVGYVLDDSRLSPAETVAINLNFLNSHDEGQAYTEQEHRDWLTEAGFTEEFERTILPNGTSIIRASKPV